MPERICGAAFFLELSACALALKTLERLPLGGLRFSQAKEILFSIFDIYRFLVSTGKRLRSTGYRKLCRVNGINSMALGFEFQE